MTCIHKEKKKIEETGPKQYAQDDAEFSPDDTFELDEVHVEDIQCNQSPTDLVQISPSP